MSKADKEALNIVGAALAELAEQIEDEIFGEARKELIELERAVMPRLQPCQYGKVSDRFSKLHEALK